MNDVEPVHFVRTTYTYASPLTKQGPTDLLVDLYLPRNVLGPWPLVTWLHAGGFRTGTRRNRKHGLVADGFARQGYVRWSSFFDQFAALLRWIRVSCQAANLIGSVLFA
jgi:acetyl esterase/lipase